MKGLIFGVHENQNFEFDVEMANISNALDDALNNSGISGDEEDEVLNVNVSDITNEIPQANLLDINGQETDNEVSFNFMN